MGKSTTSMAIFNSYVGLSENSVPYTQWLMIIIPTKWL